MIIQRTFSLALDENEYIKLHGEGFAKLLAQPKRREAFLQVKQEALELAQPAAVWERFPIQELRHEKLVLANGARIAAYQRAREMLSAMMLDELASWLLDSVRQNCCSALEAELKGQDWRTSAPLSPGESAWSVKEQQILFQILDTSVIGVTLTRSLVMVPLKSLSFIIGTGRQPIGVEGASNCDFCSMKEYCRYRLLRPHA